MAPTWGSSVEGSSTACTEITGSCGGAVTAPPPVAAGVFDFVSIDFASFDFFAFGLLAGAPSFFLPDISAEREPLERFSALCFSTCGVRACFTSCFTARFTARFHSALRILGHGPAHLLSRLTLSEREFVLRIGVGVHLLLAVVLKLALVVELLGLDLQRLLGELGFALGVDVEVEAPVDKPLRGVAQVGLRHREPFVHLLAGGAPARRVAAAKNLLDVAVGTLRGAVIREGPRLEVFLFTRGWVALVSAGAGHCAVG